MSSVIISGDTSGAVTLSVPAVAGTNTVTLPAQTGSLAVMPAGYTLGAGNTSSFKNRIINGDMRIWQRGTSFTNTANTFQYTADRWAVFSGAGLPAVNSQVTTGLSSFPYALRVQRPSGNTSTSNTVAIQEIESANCRDLAGQSVTISFQARAGANYSTASNSLSVWLVTGSGVDQGVQSAINSTWTSQLVQTTNVTLTTSFVSYTATFSIPAGTNEIALYFLTFPAGTAGTNDYFDVTGVQLEVGSQATSFDFRDYGRELIMCQRYYQGTQIYYGVKSVSAYTRQNVSLLVLMRTSPSVTFNDMVGNASKISVFSAGDVRTDNVNVIAVGGTPISFQILFNNGESQPGYGMTASMSAEL